MTDDFNLAAPPGYRGLHPDLQIRMYHRGLPHWRQDGATYFVTFRLVDSIPQEKLRALKRWRTIWEQNNPEPRSKESWFELAREITNKTEAWLDEGYGECVFLNPTAVSLMTEALTKFQNERYLTACYAIMPNHVHLVIKPYPGFELEVILKSSKGYVARQINKMLNREVATLWEEESYDRIVRDEEHLWRVIQYIGRNPRKAGLPRGEWYRWIHPDWEAAGWRFLDETNGGVDG